MYIEKKINQAGAKASEELFDDELDNVIGGSMGDFWGALESIPSGDMLGAKGTMSKPILSYPR